MDIIPTDISTYGEDVEGLLNEIQSRNEKLFELTFLLMNTADNKENWTILCIRLQESPRNIIAIYGDFNISRNRDLWHHYHWE